MTRKPLDHELLKKMLRYDPRDGNFYWLISRKPRTKPGDFAGTDATGYYVVTISGVQYPAHRLAWFYTHGEWPVGDVRFRDGNRLNTRIENLSYAPTPLSMSKAAVYARARYARKKDPQSEQAMRSAPRVIDEVVWSRTEQCWKVYLPPRLTGGRNNLLIHRAPTFELAARLYHERLEAIAWLDRHPAPSVTDADRHIHAGATGNALSYADAHRLLAYDPDTGRFYWREKKTRLFSETYYPRQPGDLLAMGRRADELNAAGTPVVNYGGRDYPAHMLAVFMQTRVWPGRGVVRRKDGNKANTAWANLEFKDMEPTDA